MVGGKKKPRVHLLNFGLLSKRLAASKGLKRNLKRQPDPEAGERVIGVCERVQLSIAGTRIQDWGGDTGKERLDGKAPGSNGECGAVKWGESEGRRPQYRFHAEFGASTGKGGGTAFASARGRNPPMRAESASWDSSVKAAPGGDWGKCSKQKPRPLGSAEGATRCPGGCVGRCRADGWIGEDARRELLLRLLEAGPGAAVEGVDLRQGERQREAIASGSVAASPEGAGKDLPPPLADVKRKTRDLRRQNCRQNPGQPESSPHKLGGELLSSAGSHIRSYKAGPANLWQVCHQGHADPF